MAWPRCASQTARMDKFGIRTIWIVKVDGRTPDRWDRSDEGVESLRLAVSNVSLAGFSGGASLALEGDRFEFQRVVAVSPSAPGERQHSAERAVAEMCESLEVLEVDVEWAVMGYHRSRRHSAPKFRRRLSWLRRVFRRSLMWPLEWSQRPATVRRGWSRRCYVLLEPLRCLLARPGAQAGSQPE